MKIKLILIFILFIIIVYYIYNDFIVINNNYLVKEQYEIIDYNKIPNGYLGYIEIKKIKIKKLIKYKTTDEILDMNVVGMHEASANIDDKYGNIILAGHNNNNVFKNLLNIQLNDVITIISFNNIYKFKVIKTDEINTNNFSYFKIEYDKKILTLITCINANKRFIVVGELL